MLQSPGYSTFTASVQGGVGVDIANAGASDNLVEGNLIGTDATGERALVPSQQPASGVGVLIDSTSGSNTIGGVTAAARNVISTGIYLLGPTASGNLVQGNYIGLDPTGTSAEPNLTGVFVNDAMNNMIGGTAPGAGNVIAGNLPGSTGIYFYAGAAGNLVQSNLIGTNASGKTGKNLGLGDYGILLYNAPQNTYPTSGRGRTRSAAAGSPPPASIRAAIPWRRHRAQRPKAERRRCRPVRAPTFDAPARGSKRTPPPQPEVIGGVARTALRPKRKLNKRTAS